MDEFGSDLRTFLGESHDDGSECLIRTRYAQAVQAQAPSDLPLLTSDLAAPDASQASTTPFQAGNDAGMDGCTNA